MKRWTQLVHFDANPGDPHQPHSTRTRLSQQLVSRTQIFTTSVSFGSLISLPCDMSNAAVASLQRLFKRDPIRLSIGIEDPKDLITDLERAFKQTL